MSKRVMRTSWAPRNGEPAYKAVYMTVQSALQSAISSIASAPDGCVVRCEGSGRVLLVRSRMENGAPKTEHVASYEDVTDLPPAEQCPPGFEDHR